MAAKKKVKKAEPKKEKFPSSLFITDETDSDGTKYFLTYPTLEKVPEENDGLEIGIYKLVGTRKLRVVKALSNLP